VVVNNNIGIVDFAVTVTAFVDSNDDMNIVVFGGLKQSFHISILDGYGIFIQLFVPFAALNRRHNPVPIWITGYKNFWKSDELCTVLAGFFEESNRFINCF